MKIVETYNREGHISCIHSFYYYQSRGKSEEEIINAINETNEKYGRICNVIKEVPDELEETFLFLLGEKHYKHYSDIEDLVNTIDDLKSYVNDVSNSLSEIEDDMYRIQDKVETIKLSINK